MLFLRVQLHCAMGSNWSKFMWSMSGWCLTPFADCQCHRLSQLGQSNYINGSPSYHSVCVWCVSTASTSFIQCPVRGCRIPENETRENFVSIAWFFLLGVHCRVLFLFFFLYDIDTDTFRLSAREIYSHIFLNEVSLSILNSQARVINGYLRSGPSTWNKVFLAFPCGRGGRDTSPSSSGGPEQIKKKLTKPSTIRTKSSLKKLGLGFIFYPNRWTLWRCGLRANNIYSNTRVGPFSTPLRTNVVLWSKKAYLNLEPELPNLSFFGNWPRPSKRNLWDRSSHGLAWMP